ncbi:MAG: hypothetical protein P8020_02335 [Acidobacteriota bacterium]
MIGQTISHYRIVEKIGEGGMGEVYLAEDTSLQRKVALKFLPAALADDELAHKRFLRELPLSRDLSTPRIRRLRKVEERQRVESEGRGAQGEITKGEVRSVRCKGVLPKSFGSCFGLVAQLS